jgi:hypothetical protein
MIVQKNIVPYLDFEFDASQFNCIWLVGDSPDVDVIWSAAQFEYTSTIDMLENFSLFDATNYKCIFKKEHESFLINSNRNNWNCKLLIKGLAEIKKNLVKDTDLVVVFPINKNLDIQLARWFCSKYNINFDESIWKILPNYTKNLKDLLVLSMLHDAQIDPQHWSEFLEEARVNWYSKFKENTLIQEAIIDDSATIPVMQYLLRADSNVKRKAIAKFILANIKNSALIWDYDNLWKDLVHRYYNK